MKLTDWLWTQAQTCRLLRLYALSLGIHLVVGLTIGDQIMYPLLKDVANNILAGNGYSFHVLGEPRAFVAYPPGYPLFLALASLLGLGADSSVRLVQIAITAVTPLVITAIVERLAKRQVSVRLFALICLWPITVTASTALGAQGFMLLASALCIWFLVKDMTGLNSFLAVLFGVLATLIRSEATFLLLVAVVIVLWRAQLSYGKRFGVVALALIPYLPWLIFLSSAAESIAFTPPGSGLNAVSVIGKWDRNSGYPYGDDEVVKWERQPDIFYPDPFGRDQARLKRAVEYVAAHPAKYFGIVALNAAAMTFGQKIYIKEDDAVSSFQGAVFRGDIREFLRSNVAGVLQRAIASGSALVSVIVGIYVVVRRRTPATLTIVAIGVLYTLFAGPFGILARYTWIGLQAWMILTFVGLASLEWSLSGLSRRLARTARLEHAG